MNNKILINIGNINSEVLITKNERTTKRTVATERIKK